MRAILIDWLIEVGVKCEIQTFGQFHIKFINSNSKCINSVFYTFFTYYLFRVPTWNTYSE